MDILVLIHRQQVLRSLLCTVVPVVLTQQIVRYFCTRYNSSTGTWYHIKGDGCVRFLRRLLQHIDRVDSRMARTETINREQRTERQWQDTLKIISRQ